LACAICSAPTALPKKSAASTGSRRSTPSSARPSRPPSSRPVTLCARSNDVTENVGKETSHDRRKPTRKGACVMTTAAQPVQQIQPVQQFWWIALLQGISAIIIGALLVVEPADTFLALIPLIGIYWLVIGILSLVRTFIDRSVPWIWSLLSGIIGVLAGIA